MKSLKIISKAMLFSVVAINLVAVVIPAAQAQDATETANTAQSNEAGLRAKEQSVGHPIDWVRQIGTDKQQNDVLMQINSGLVNGSISPAQASQFKDELNKINDKESWYKSFNTAIPANLKQENVSLLNQISSKLKPQATKSAATQVALHGDVDELIGSALAKNHISSGQAESYYLRLAQLESNIESTKNNPATPSSEIIDTNKQLAQLKSELLRKVN